MLRYLCWVCLLATPLTAGEEAPVVLADGDDAAALPGTVLDPTVKRTGAASLRWTHGDAASVALRNCPPDWTGRSHLAFWLHNARPGQATFVILAGSENPASEGADYYQATVRLDFAGWRRVVIGRSAMTPTRQPRGWDQIDHLRLTAEGWEQTLDPTVVVHLDQMELVNMVGPLLTDNELLDAFDLSLPGLEAVRRARDGGDLAGARTALAAYFRQRTSVPWWFDPHQPQRREGYDRARADRTVRGEIDQVTIWHAFPNGQVDWFANPTLTSDELPDNHEWQWQLNRMGFWGELGAAWWATGDEVYAKTFVEQLRSWVRNCPRPANAANSAGSAWRTIETGIRLAGSWPNAWHRFLTSESFTADDLLLYVTSVIEQARYLREFQTTGNWLTMELNGLYTTAVLFPELQEAAEWRQFAGQRLYEELDAQFLPDGAQVELTPGYHQVALGNILSLPRLAKLTGRTAELPADFTARMQKAYDFNLYLRTPDDDLPRFNDSWETRVSRAMGATAEVFPDREDFRWARTNGREGRPPAETSHAFPYAGYYVMRSGWEADANYAVLDAGPLGYGHYHQDKLNLVLWGYGRCLLFDGGGGSYERSKWRSYGVDTFSHNTVLVDGQPQRRGAESRRAILEKQPVDARWATSATQDFAAGAYTAGYGRDIDRLATHTRRVVFLKPDLFVVVDTLVPNDAAEHTYQARWHLATVQTKQTGLAVETADEGQPNLALVPLVTEGLEVRAATQQTEPELLGWWPDKDKQPQVLPATTVLHTVKGAGVKQLVTLLVPLRKGETNPVEGVRATGTLGYEVTLRGGRVSIAVDADPAGEVRVERP